MPFYVLCFATVASLTLILCGPICVDCFYNFVLDNKCVDFPPKCVFLFWDAGTTQTPCSDAFLLNSDSYHAVASLSQRGSELSQLSVFS